MNCLFWFLDIFIFDLCEFNLIFFNPETFLLSHLHAHMSIIQAKMTNRYDMGNDMVIK